MALVAPVRLELFDVLVYLLFRLAGLLLNDFAQRCINVLGLLSQQWFNCRDKTSQMLNKPRRLKIGA